MKIPFIVPFLVFYAFSAIAQSDINLQHLNKTFQRNYTNPAFVPDLDAHIGLPVLSNTYIGISNPALLRASLKVKGDGRGVNDFLTEMKTTGSVSASMAVDYFSLGVKAGNGYILLNASEKLKGNFDYPENLIDIVQSRDFSQVGTEFKVNFSANIIEYTEIGAGYAHNFNDKLQLGGRLKYYMGKISVQSNQAEFILSANTDELTIDAQSNLNMNISVLNHEPTIKSNFFKSGNHGFGMDLGAVYNLNEKLQFSASVLDIGYINWENNSTNYAANGRKSTDVMSMDAGYYLSDSTTSGANLGAFKDSVFNILGIEETATTYRQAMPRQFYLGGKYQFHPKFAAGANFHGESFANQFTPSLSVFTSGQFGEILNMVLSYTVNSNSYNAIGLGAALNVGSLQFYAVTNNLPDLVAPKSDKFTDIRVGTNFIITSKK